MTKHSTNKDITRYQHVELHPSQIKIYQCQHRSKINNSQANMFPQKSSKPTTASPKNCNISEVQDKDHKIVYINMIEDLKEELSKSIKEIYENSHTPKQTNKKKWKK